MGKFAKSWQIMKASWDVLKKDKEMLMFPVFSGIASIVVIASFVSPILISPDNFAFMSESSGSASVLSYLYLFLFYVVSYFTVIFFNTGLVACAVKRLKGGDPTVGYGLKEAGSRFFLILGWAIIAATVGMILRAIEQRAKGIGSFVVKLLGAGWSLVTFFIIPILVVENLGPISALKASGALLKKTWGEQLIGNFGFGIIFFLLSLLGIVGIAAGIMLASTIGLVLIGISILYLVTIGLISSTLGAIFQAALYLHAKDGEPIQGFSDDVLQGTIVAG